MGVLVPPGPCQLGLRLAVTEFLNWRPQLLWGTLSTAIFRFWGMGSPLGFLQHPVPFSEPCLYLQRYAFIKLLVNRVCPNVPYLSQGDPDQYRALENRLRRSSCSWLGKGTRWAPPIWGSLRLKEPFSILHTICCMILKIIFKVFLNLLQYCFCFPLWFFGCEACGIWDPQPGTEPAPPALEGKILTTGQGKWKSLLCDSCFWNRKIYHRSTWHFLQHALASVRQSVFVFSCEP